MSSILLPISPAGTTNVASGLWLASGIMPASGIYTASGISVTTSISGNTVFVASGLLSVSSGVVTIASGIVWMEPSTQSGHSMVLEVGKNIFNVAASGVGLGSNQSGGLSLQSCGPLISLTIRSQSGNLPMLIGGNTQNNAPFISGGIMYGIELFGNESLTLKVNNANLVNVFNETAGSSGQRVTMVGLGQT